MKWPCIGCIRSVLHIFFYIECVQSFEVYWNVPSQGCQRFGIYVNASAFGIVQNTGDKFYGDKVNINYSPGEFPYFNNGQEVHGGIPQNGSLIEHVQKFRDQVNEKLPPDFKGVAVLDFEQYYPSYNMSLPKYKEASRSWISSRHPEWSPEKVKSEAIRTFNSSARQFFESLLWTGREMRPNALWGYYHYPYCHNYGPRDAVCQPKVVAHNDDMLWLMGGSTALYPSIYIFKNSGWDPITRRRNAQTRIKEALRVRWKTGEKIQILPYFWYMYHDVITYLSPVDITNTLGLTKVMNLEGAVIWGSSRDLNTRAKCLYFKSFLEEKLGPLVQYIRRFPRSTLRRVINSRILLQKFSRSAMRDSSLSFGSQSNSL